MAEQEPFTGTLRTDIELIRGERPLLFDRQADAYYRIDPAAVEVVALLAESMPISDFLSLLARNGIEISREELLSLLAFLQQNNLLTPEYGHIGIKREKQTELREKTLFLRFSAAYLFFKLPPWRPEQFFEKIGPHVSWLASKPILILLALPALAGYLLALRDFGTVRSVFLDSLSWAGLVKYFAAILLLKFVHEAAHSLAAIHFHCRVRGIGIGFMVFYPRLYTDTTDSWRLPRRQRLLIDAAGIIVELLLGGIAALCWTYLPPGAGKSTMFYIFAVSTLSTLFVNGNPFIRYDGYYILCDLANIENLMSRSGEYVRRCWRWYCLRLGEPPRESRGIFLFCFGVCSFFYRIFLYTSIILLIYHKFVKALALVMMVLELYCILIYPFWREVRTIRALSKRSANRARWILGMVVLAVAGLLLFVPLSWSETLPGETVPEERQLVTVPESGYLVDELPRRSRVVAAGEVLFSLESPQLEHGIRRLQAILDYDETLHRLQEVDGEHFSESIVTAEKIASDQLSLDELTRRRDKLTVRAEREGIFVPGWPSLSSHTFLAKGRPMGEVVSGSLAVTAYATDREIGKLRIGGPATVTVRDSLAKYEAVITAIDRVPARLKDSPLLFHYGGPIPVYANGGKSDEYTSVLPLYRIELAFSVEPDLDPGRVVTVKIRHTERLGERIWMLMLSAFRKEF